MRKNSIRPVGRGYHGYGDALRGTVWFRAQDGPGSHPR